ncbi:MAG: SH3 domain-containing protein [Ruminococcaceae bacterium]|nr:SH3 domain-containing protein [Oscillospiraceae bacterium]
MSAAKKIIIRITKYLLLLCILAALFVCFHTNVPELLKLPEDNVVPEAPTEATKPTEPPTEPPKRAFVIADTLNIRKEANSSSEKVGTYAYGAEVFIYEETTASNGVPWGRTDKGWVCLSYVHFGDEVPPTEPPAKPPAVSLKDENTVSGKVMTKLSGTNIYVSADYVGKFTLTINSERFPNVGKAVWTVGGQTAVTGVRTLTVDVPANGTTIKLSVAGESFTYTVKIIGFSSVAGVKLGGTAASGSSPSLKLNYTANSAWSLAPIYGYTHGLTSDNSPVSVNAAFAVTIPEEYQNIIEYSGGKLKVKSGVTKDQKVAFDVTSGEKSLRVTLNLIDERLLPAFAIAYSANTKSRYGFTYTVGTNGTIKLGTLFRLLSGRTLDAKQNIVITIKSGSSVLSQKSFPANSDWASQKIAVPAKVSACDISIQYAAAKAVTLSVKVVNGAYNVEDAASWKAVPDGVSIAVLKGFSIPKTNVAVMRSGKGQYAKSIGAQTIYGNLVKISVPSYIIKAEQNNFFLATSGGTLQDVVIEGPSYGTKVSVLRSDGVELGTFVSGLEATGATIKNSYLSGFRQPLRVNGGNITIQNSTLCGGNIANIYVHASAKFKLTNVKTIQFEKDGAIGMGIFLNNPATKNTFEINKLTQYNYLTKAQVDGFVKRAIGNVGALVSIKDEDLQKIAKIKHGNAYHCGIILCGDAQQMSNITGGNVKNTYVRTDTITKGTWKLKSYIAFYGQPTCSSCNHSTVKNYNADDFLDSK